MTKYLLAVCILTTVACSSKQPVPPPPPVPKLCPEICYDHPEARVCKGTPCDPNLP